MITPHVFCQYMCVYIYIYISALLLDVRTKISHHLSLIMLTLHRLFENAFVVLQELKPRVGPEIHESMVPIHQSFWGKKKTWAVS